MPQPGVPLRSLSSRVSPRVSGLGEARCEIPSGMSRPNGPSESQPGRPSQTERLSALRRKASIWEPALVCGGESSQPKCPSGGMTAPDGHRALTVTAAGRQRRWAALPLPPLVVGSVNHKPLRPRRVGRGGRPSHSLHTRTWCPFFCVSPAVEGGRRRGPSVPTPPFQRGPQLVTEALEFQPRPTYSCLCDLLYNQFPHL